MEGLKVINFPEAKWEPHPQLPGVEVAYLVSNQHDAVNITCALVHLQAGAAPAKHSHENSDDILYVLKGKAKMWVEGYGDVPLEPWDVFKNPQRDITPASRHQGGFYCVRCLVSGHHMILQTHKQIH